MKRGCRLAQGMQQTSTCATLLIFEHATSAASRWCWRLADRSASRMPAELVCMQQCALLLYTAVAAGCIIKNGSQALHDLYKHAQQRHSAAAATTKRQARQQLEGRSSKRQHHTPATSAAGACLKQLWDRSFRDAALLVQQCDQLTALQLVPILGCCISLVQAAIMSNVAQLVSCRCIRHFQLLWLAVLPCMHCHR